jgi:hypothetical protein
MGTCIVAVGVSIALAVVLAGCGEVPQSASARACARAVLGDWADGRIDHAHPGDCYLAAIDALPEDLRAYSSAADDIARAWRSRTRSQASGSGSSAHGATAAGTTSRGLYGELTAGGDAVSSGALRGPSAAVLALVGVALAVVASGLGAALVRRRRERS